MKNKFKITLYYGSVLDCNCEAIVNAANEGLYPGGGVCGAIFSAAGAMQLAMECQAIGHCETGSAVITGGCKLKQKYIIHAVGPIYNGSDDNELLKKTYKSILDLCNLKSIRTVAIPCISTGIYGYPKDKAAAKVLEVLNTYEDNKALEEVVLAVYDSESYRIYEDLLNLV